MNKNYGTPQGPTETEQLAAFTRALITGTPVSSGKGFGTNPAAAKETRSVGRDAQRAAGPVQTNANKVNPKPAPGTGAEALKFGAEAPENLDKWTPKERLSESDLYAERLETAELRRSIRGISRLPRIQKCCHTIRREAGVGIVHDYTAKKELQVSGYRGLYTCGSVWGCDRCGGMIQRQRFLEVWQAMDQWTKVGATIPTQHRDYGFEGKGGRGLLWENEPDGEQIQGPAGYIDAKDGGIVWPGVNDTILDTETGELTERPLRRFNLVDTDVKHAPGSIAFMTLTMGHEAAKEAGTKWAAAPLWNAESAAFKGFTNDKFFKGNIHAYQRSTEVQWSERAGWHIHIHVSLYVSKGFRRSMKQNKEALFKAWAAAVKLQGYEAKVQGFDLRMCTDMEKDARKLAQYLTKGSSGGSRGLAAEMTVNGAKKSVYSISPAQMRLLLHEARMGRESPAGTPAMLRVPLGKYAKRYERLLAAYREFEEASRGKRWMTWSRGAKAAFGIQDIDDTAVTAASEGEEDGDAMPLDEKTGEIGGFKSADWRRLARNVSTPVYLRRLVEGAGDAAGAEQAITGWAAVANKGAGAGGVEVHGFIGEQDWNERLKEIGERQDAEAAAAEKTKHPKWASGINQGSYIAPGTHGRGWHAERAAIAAEEALLLWDEEGEEPAEYFPGNDFAA